MKGDRRALTVSAGQQRSGRGSRGRGAYRVLQGGEADEAEEELSTRGHGHGRVHATQGFYGIGEVRPQALQCLPCNDVRNVMFI